MKKCPKCGTILDDSKKKCYMCGADLLRSSITNFGDSFNEQIGATVTKSQDNVFNNVDNITAKIDDVVSSNNYDNVTFSQKSSSADFFKNELNGLNSLQYDDRTSLEKIFSNDTKFNNTNSIDANEAIKNNNKEPLIQSGEYSPTNNVPESSNVSNQFVNNDTEQKQKKNKDSDKPKINWGNNLTGNGRNDVFNFRDKVSKRKINISFIVNTTCFILFLIGMGYIFFTYIKPRSGGNSSFGGLNYSIDSKFELKTDNANNRYYTKDSDCSIRINYGAANNTDGFIESYFEGIKETYENQDGYTTSTEKMQINGNMWSELNIIEIKGNSSSSSGYSTSFKYRHVSIVYNSNFYDVVFTNLNDDTECSTMYTDFVNSLSFD